MSVDTTPRQLSAKSKRILGALTTPNGSEWLNMALDPFFDGDLIPTGYPDTTSTSSVVQTIRKEVTITSSSTSTWDCHALFMPVMPGTTLGSSLEYNIGLLEPSGFTTGTVFGVPPASTFSTITGPSGFDWTNTASSSLTLNTVTALPQSFTYSQCRLVGGGFEVHNVTPELTAGGTISCWRSPGTRGNSYYTQTLATSAQTTTVTTGATGSKRNSLKTDALSTVFAPLEVCAMPPSSLAEASLLPNTVTWDSKKGAYMIFAQNSTDNDINNFSPGCVAFTKAFNAASNYSVAMYSDGNNQAHHLMPFDACGCILSGCPPGSTFTFVVKYFLEVFPPPTDNLATVSKPSPEYDPAVLAIYSHSLQSLPVAVPVGMNPRGEWFQEVLEDIGKWASPIGNALSTIFPPAAAIGNIVGPAAKAIGTLAFPNDRREKKDKKKEKPQQISKALVPAQSGKRGGGKTAPPARQVLSRKARKAQAKNRVKLFDAWAAIDKRTM
jgi:hypothetical protein